MTEEILNRSSLKIDEVDYNRLIKLHIDNSWLNYEPQALFQLWCLSDCDEHKDIIEFLIKNFSYIDERSLNEGTNCIAKYIESDLKLSPKDTFIVATSDSNKPDGSQLLLQNLKNKFSINWKETNFINSIGIGANQIPNNSNIIIIDDFIGSGDKISKKIKYVQRKINERELNNVTISIVCLAAMKFSKVVLDELYVSYYSVHWLKKGISELVSNENKEVAIKSMEELEGKLQKKYHGKKLPNFGYNKSESLFAIGSSNIPNNVFPIFWWPFLKGGTPRKTIFKRV